MSAYAEEQLKALGVAQVLVVLKQPAAATAAAMAIEKHFSQPDTAPQKSMAAALSLRARGGRGRAKVAAKAMHIYPNLGLAYGTVDREGLIALRQDKEHVKKVVSAPAFRLIRPKAVADAKPTQKITWGIQALAVDQVWKEGFTGKGILVGHLDTGVDGTHPVLEDAIDEFVEFNDLGEMVSPSPKAHDSDEHGTHTAGTIAGRPFKQGKQTISVGVAPDAKLACALVIEGGDVDARVLGGMNWAVGKGVRVLNLSLGIPGYHDDFRVVTRILRERNVLPVFASGNEGPGTSRSPGNYPEALSVGAYDHRGEMAYFSSSQRFDRPDDPLVPDLVGPGVNVISARPGGGFKSMDGTSMATPHIAGLAAMLFQAKPTATPDQVEAAIFGSCERTVGMPQEQANRGAPNAVRALELLLG